MFRENSSLNLANFTYKVFFALILWTFYLSPKILTNFMSVIDYTLNGFVNMKTLTNMNWIWRCVEFWSLFFNQNGRIKFGCKIEHSIHSNWNGGPSSHIRAKLSQEKAKFILFSTSKDLTFTTLPFYPEFSKNVLVWSKPNSWLVGWVDTKLENIALCQTKIAPSI